MCSSPYFENKEIDPRDCRYKPNSKIRKQIDQIIRACKTRHNLYKPVENDAYAKLTSVKNRAKKKLVEESKEKEQNLDDVKSRNFSKEEIVNYLQQIDDILAHEDEQKQAFSYGDLVKLHQLLQYLEGETETYTNKEPRIKKQSDMPFQNQYFFQFMENNFRVIQPEKRKNEILDQRLRKLRCKSASNEYQTMTANVSRAIRGSGTSNFSVGDEIRNIRPTLIATANALMVIIATFAFFYFCFAFARPDYSIANRVLFSFSASMVVAVAEIYFLIRII
ncbi:hypothetical protein RDWZM_003834 [Blomia tropicalis]|uniref:Transmembrane protein n=1 Tax=Blomia tropicalis TaxID=40697 RepID=A0A9Q0MGW1_BLOTA|nr:hypothetical protein RDWZM_003834 [Blomia tropicalis]